VPFSNIFFQKSKDGFLVQGVRQKILLLLPNFFKIFNKKFSGGKNLRACLKNILGAGSSSDSSLPGEVKQEPTNGQTDKSHIECVVS